MRCSAAVAGTRRRYRVVFFFSCSPSSTRYESKRSVSPVAAAVIGGCGGASSLPKLTQKRIKVVHSPRGQAGQRNPIAYPRVHLNALCSTIPPNFGRGARAVATGATTVVGGSGQCWLPSGIANEAETSRPDKELACS